jgi:hypothetical protein
MRNGSRSNPSENNFEIISVEAFDDFLIGVSKYKRGSYGGHYVRHFLLSVLCIFVLRSGMPALIT